MCVFFLISLAVFSIASAATVGGEPAGFIPPAELQALDRAIARELNSGQLGSQTLGDLTRLKNRLLRMSSPGKSEKDAALEPLAGDDTLRSQLERLEAEAGSGGRAAQRSLALFHLFLNDPEKSLAQWRRMGMASEYDVPYLLIAAYLEFALGEYNRGRRSLESALRFVDSRTSLSVASLVFCQTVAGYRMYIPRNPGNFLPGEEALIYIEVEGVDFKVTAEGSECRLRFGLQLKDDDQITLWSESNYGEYAPVFAGPVRDLHAVISWRVPNDLSPGRYHLFVEAVEEASKRRGESVIGFNVGRRETNPERRPSGGLDPRGMPQGLIDAQKAFPGAPPMFMEPPRLRDEQYYRQFDLLQQHERNQRVEK
ncbi:MAG: hypothetical protein FWG74_02105 [Planctomycetes bacterium]|nr:hypothetical protein [Planctomycetota bacterium]